MIKIKTIKVTCLEENLRIIWCDKTNEALIVDPGAVSLDAVNFIKEHNLNLKSILITHSHFDHIGGVNFIKNNFKDALLYAHEAERDLRSHVNEMMAAVGIFDENCFNSDEPDCYLRENEEISLGDETFKVIFTPGHSKGGVAYYNENNKILLSGDTLFKGSIGRTDFIGGDFNEIIKSIKEKLFVLPNDTVVYSGHGKTTTILDEKNYNPYF